MATRSKTFTRISRIPGVVGGEPVIDGTRVPVRVLVQAMRFSDNDSARVLTGYPRVSQEALTEALAYYEQHREEIEGYIRENEDEGED